MGAATQTTCNCWCGNNLRAIPAADVPVPAAMITWSASGINPNISSGISATAPIVVSNEDALVKSTSTKINITNNFPLQKWVYLVISVDNTVVDCYLDGKLIKSVKAKQVNPTRESDLVFGLGFDAYIAQFQRWTNPLDPQSVWNSYVSGSGSTLAGTDSNYNVALSVLKDNVITSKLTLY